MTSTPPPAGNTLKKRFTELSISAERQPSKQRLNKSDYPTNPALPEDYEAVRSLDYSSSEKLTEPFDSIDGTKSEAVLNLLRDEVIKLLSEYHKICPPNKDLEKSDFKSERFDMTHTNGPGNYYIGDKGEEKNGRCTRTRDTYNNRYSNVKYARVVSNYDRYPPELLRDYISFIKGPLRDAMRIDDEDLASYSGMKAYEEETGLNPFLPILLDAMIKNGHMKRGVTKNLILDLNEIAIEVAGRARQNPKVSKKNPMEILGGKYLDVWKRGIDTISNEGGRMISLMTELLGKPPNSLTWVPCKSGHVASWAPNTGTFRTVEFGDTSSSSDSNARLSPSIRSIIETNIDNIDGMLEELSIELDMDIPAERFGTVPNDVSVVTGLVEKVLLELEVAVASEGEKQIWIIIVTIYIYYRITGKSDSFFDPAGTVDEGWDTSCIDAPWKRDAISKMSAAIDDLMAGHDVEDAHQYIYYMMFDTNSVVFNGLGGAEALIRSKEYHALGRKESEELVAGIGSDGLSGFEVGQIKVFWRFNTSLKQYSFILLHRPLSRAFNNRAPWDPYPFDDEEFNAQVDAAFSADFMVAFHNYIDGKCGSIIASESTDSFQCSTLFKAWMSRRAHADLQVSTLYQKYFAVRGEDSHINPLAEGTNREHGFTNKYLNTYDRNLAQSTTTRGRQSMVAGDDLRSAIFYSRWTGVDVEEAIKQACEEIIIHDLQGNRRKHLHTLPMLERIRREHFRERSIVFKNIVKYVSDKHDEHVENAREENAERMRNTIKGVAWQQSLQRRNQETFDRHYNILVKAGRDLNNWWWTGDDDDDAVLLLERSEHKATQAYLCRLNESSEVEDAEKKQIIEELGWTWNKKRYKKALDQKMLHQVDHETKDLTTRMEDEKERMHSKEGVATLATIKEKTKMGGGVVDSSALLNKYLK